MGRRRGQRRTDLHGTGDLVTHASPGFMIQGDAGGSFVPVVRTGHWGAVPPLYLISAIDSGTVGTVGSPFQL